MTNGKRKINTITVLGASGNMGVNVSALFASFADTKVYMVCRTKKQDYIERAVKSVRSDSIRKNLYIVDYSMLPQCLAESDLVFESVAEDLNIKEEINALVARYISTETLFCTGTSGLSVTEMAKKLPENLRANYFGMHLFNPPYNMTLCELIFTEYNSRDLLFSVKDYLETILYRTVIIVKDEPAFLANRVGFYFINKALQYAETYKEQGGIDYIDAILGTFTGRIMKPCETANFVGLDVHKAIVDNLYFKTNDSENYFFKLPEYVQKLIDENKLGKKTNAGLYKLEVSENGTTKELVYDIELDAYREKRNYSFSFAMKMKKYFKDGDYELAFQTLLKDTSFEANICKDFLKSYYDYSLYVAQQVTEDVYFVDDAMATGFNWCPPLAIANLLFGKKYQTRYDFRSFFKAGD